VFPPSWYVSAKTGKFHFRWLTLSELEGAEAKKKRLEDKKPALITERICRVAEIRELELWLMTLQNEIDDRVVERMGRLQE
jgi:hypothetical protein